MQVELQQLNLKRYFQSMNILVLNSHSNEGRNYKEICNWVLHILGKHSEKDKTMGTNVTFSYV